MGHDYISLQSRWFPFTSHHDKVFPLVTWDLKLPRHIVEKTLRISMGVNGSLNRVLLGPPNQNGFFNAWEIPFFSQSKQHNTWSPAYIGVVPVHIHINVTSCWIDLYLSFLCLRGQIMAISCILGCLWPVVIENLRYSSTYILFAAKDHTVCFGIDVIQGCPTSYCTYRSFIELSQAPICKVCQTSNFGCNLI